MKTKSGNSNESFLQTAKLNCKYKILVQYYTSCIHPYMSKFCICIASFNEKLVISFLMAFDPLDHYEIIISV